MLCNLTIQWEFVKLNKKVVQRPKTPKMWGKGNLTTGLHETEQYTAPIIQLLHMFTVASFT